MRRSVTSSSGQFPSRQARRERAGHWALDAGRWTLDERREGGCSRRAAFVGHRSRSSSSGACMGPPRCSLSGPGTDMDGDEGSGRGRDARVGLVVCRVTRQPNHSQRPNHVAPPLVRPAACSFQCLSRRSAWPVQPPSPPHSMPLLSVPRPWPSITIAQPLPRSSREDTPPPSTTAPSDLRFALGPLPRPRCRACVRACCFTSALLLLPCCPAALWHAATRGGRDTATADAWLQRGGQPDRAWTRQSVCEVHSSETQPFIQESPLLQSTNMSSSVSAARQHQRILPPAQACGRCAVASSRNSSSRTVTYSKSKRRRSWGALLLSAH